MAILQANAPIEVPVGGSITRLGDKLRNAYGIDILGAARSAAQEKGISLVSLDSTQNNAAQEQYQEQKQSFLQRYWIPLVVALAALLLLRR
jgi:chromosome condensin MukBEF MukE localization factor